MDVDAMPARRCGYQPPRAKSDPATVFPLDELPALLERLARIAGTAR